MSRHIIVVLLSLCSAYYCCIFYHCSWHFIVVFVLLFSAFYYCLFIIVLGILLLSYYHCFRIIVVVLENSTSLRRISRDDDSQPLDEDWETSWICRWTYTCWSSSESDTRPFISPIGRLIVSTRTMTSPQSPHPPKSDLCGPSTALCSKAA